LGDAALIFRLADFVREGVTGFLEAGKIPEVWEIAALLRLDGLHGTIITVQKNAAAIRFFLQGQPATIPGQPRVLLDEIGLVHAFERREPRDLLSRQTHLPRPAAAGRATLAFIENRHAGRLAEPGFT